MQNYVQGFSLAIISMVGLGVSTFLYKQSTSAIGPVNTTFFYYLFSFIIATVVWFFFREGETFEKTKIIWPVLISIFLYTSVLSFNFAVKHLDVSIGSTIRSLSFVVTVIFALIFYKEQLHAKDFVALGFAIIAILLFGLDLKAFK